MKVGILGLGRIGKVHFDTIQNRVRGAEVWRVVTPQADNLKQNIDFDKVRLSTDPNDIFNDEQIEAVLVCSPSDTHAEYIIRGAQAGKAIFCEKPLDLSIEKIKEILNMVESYDVPLMVAFNQRFDPDFYRVKTLIDNGELGDLRTIKITSRDPAPPPIDYIKKSGGMFLDMTIHDFDMARFIAQSEVREVFAQGRNLLGDDIKDAGDIDSGIVILNFENDVTAIIENSREAVYGYDQRLEVFGDKGMTIADNNLKDTHILLNKSGIHQSRPLDFFMDRYMSSYQFEIEVFIKSIEEGKTPPVTGEDGLKATIIALAANKSMRENRPVQISEIL